MAFHVQPGCTHLSQLQLTSLLKLVPDFRRAHSLPWFQDTVSLHKTHERVPTSELGSRVCEEGRRLGG